MSRRGDGYDNAVMEAFFSSLKSALADRFDSCGTATMELFDYIEVFYNQRRRHSTLGQISPAAFEKRAARRMDPVEHCPERSVPPAPPALSSSSEEEHITKADQLTATVHGNGSGPFVSIRGHDAVIVSRVQVVLDRHNGKVSGPGELLAAYAVRRGVKRVPVVSASVCGESMVSKCSIAHETDPIP